MYTVEKYKGMFMIRYQDETSFILGPFTSESDAYFIAQMFQSDKIRFTKDDDYGKKDA